MTDIRHGASSADEGNFVSAYFDLALRRRENEVENAPDRDSGAQPAASRHAELPPQEADSE